MTRLRFSFVPSPLTGHVNPTLAVAAALSDAGHEVSYHLPARFHAAVQTAGATLVPYASPPSFPLLAGASPQRRFALTPIAMTAAAVDVLPEVLDALTGRSPDVVVYDMLSVWGRMASELLEVPAAMVSASYAMNDSFSYLRQDAGGPDARWAEALDCFAHSMHLLSRRHGTPRLRLLDILHHAEPLMIVFVPRELHPAADSFDDRYVFAGPSIRPELAHGDTPPTTHGDEKPLVYASLGTMFGDWQAFCDICCDAFADRRHRVLVAGFPAPADPPAGDVVIAPEMPQLAVLSRADVFVTHGGMNSVMEALHDGVPMVLVPQMSEQEITAQRIAGTGAGLAIDPATLTATRLRAAVEEVLGDPGYRAAAQRLRATVHRGDGAATAAAALIRYGLSRRRCRIA